MLQKISGLTNVVFFAIVIYMNNNQNQPQKIDDLLAGSIIGEPDQARKQEVSARDLDSEVAALTEDIQDTVDAARSGAELDPAKIAEQNMAFLQAKSQQEINRQETTDR